jgi:spastic paraplegia protein 7
MLKTGEVLKLEVSSSHDKAYIYLHPGAHINGAELKSNTGPHYAMTVPNTDILEQKLTDAQIELGVNPSNFVPVVYRREGDILPTFLASMTTIAIIGAVWYFLSYRTGGRGIKGGDGGMSTFNPFAQMSRAKTTVITEATPDMMKMSDVAGMKEAKMEVMEFIDYLKSPTRFTRLGARIPKGALLHGPPGTGKTLLAKAVAGEASVPFISIAGSDFVEMFAGVGSARVRDLFGQARKMSPCILYIDEVDAIGRSRKSGPSSGGHNEQESTLNQLLVELDGIHTLEGVVVMASTNRVDILDKALLRPGRFDRQISIELPTLPERMEIFELYLKQLKLKDSVEEYSKRLASLTPGHSGADIANVCNEAALHTARHGGSKVASENLEYAIERVIAGMERYNNPLSAEERRVVAYHEAGHALVGWMLEHTDPVLKMSIVPRTKGMLGFAQYLPSDQKLHTKEEIADRMCVALGGRVAEAITFKKVTTGAQDDLKQVTDLARQMVTVFGMSPTIGNISFPTEEEMGAKTRPYSNHLATEIDRVRGTLMG